MRRISNRANRPFAARDHPLRCAAKRRERVRGTRTTAEIRRQLCVNPPSEPERKTRQRKRAIVFRCRVGSSFCQRNPTVGKHPARVSRARIRPINRASGPRPRRRQRGGGVLPDRVADAVAARMDGRAFHGRLGRLVGGVVDRARRADDPENPEHPSRIGAISVRRDAGQLKPRLVGNDYLPCVRQRASLALLPSSRAWSRDKLIIKLSLISYSKLIFISFSSCFYFFICSFISFTIK